MHFHTSVTSSFKSSSGAACGNGKCTARSLRERSGNSGSAVVEATIGIALFCFLSLAFYHILHIHAVKECVYSALTEAAEYTAEFAYLTERLEENFLGGEEDEGTDSAVDTVSLFAVAEEKLLTSIDEPELIDKYVLGGRIGLSLLGSEFYDENGDIVLTVHYMICISTPMLPDLNLTVEQKICQKPYLGHDTGGGASDAEERDPYVFVTDNCEVYHKSRVCTHLYLSTHTAWRSTAESSGYRACEYCGSEAEGVVYICDEGDAYHSKATCRGLKRTVYRKRLSEVKGVPPCSRCGY